MCQNVLFFLKIRELLNSELDDGLLDDDNASFSSHDLRSSGYSRDTPFSEDFSEQAPQTIFNGQDAKQIIPPERGAFERPPLITQRAFNFINGSGQNQDRINQPYGYDASHDQYGDYYANQGCYRERESPYDGQVDGYEQSYDRNEGDGNNYRMLPDDDDVDEGFDQYGNYNPQQMIQGQLPPSQDPYHYHSSQPHYPSSNFNKGNNSSGDHDFNQDYGGYNEEGSQGQNVYDNGTESAHINAQNHYRIDTPGNYRVQYQGKREPYPHISDRGSDRHVKETTDIGNGFSEDGAQDIVQLQILYKARGRKLEELAQMLKNQEEEMTKEIRVLNHQNAMMKGTMYTIIFKKK